MSIAALLRTERDAPRRFLHIATQGVRLAQAGQRLAVYKGKEKLVDIPVLKLRAILAYGDVRPSRGAIRLCLDEGVSLGLFTRTGRFRGRLASALDDGAGLRLLQYRRSLDAAFCLAWSKGIVRGKLQSALRHLEAKRRGHAFIKPAAVRQIEETLPKLDRAASCDELRGLEGSSAAAYFAALREWVPADVQFPGRKIDHPDALNTLLNFGYTLLYREAEGLAAAAGLDPAIGFYHCFDRSRASLACDMAEEFRHDFVDKLVLTLLNKRQLNPAKHFLPGGGPSAPDAAGGRLRLTPEGIAVFVGAYEEAAAPVRTEFLDQLERVCDSIESGAPYGPRADS